MAAGDLDTLARTLGVEDGWWDFFGEWRVVSPDTKRAFVDAMGIAADTGEALARSLRRIEDDPWRRWLEPVVVWTEGGRPELVLSLAANRQADLFQWSLDEEIGIVHRGDFRPADLPEDGWRDLADGPRVRRRLTLPAMPPAGYHRLRVENGEASAETLVIVAPPRAYVPAELLQGSRLWGLSAHVYALRSANDWGMGDYHDLRSLAEGAAKLGAAAIGVNPLHALFPSRPERYSPYSPSSRIFVNVLYLDIEALPDLAESPEARAMLSDPQFARGLAEVRGRERVDYVGVAQQKMPVLRAVYESFARHHLGDDGGEVSDRGQAFRAFQREGGRAAELFATFEALQEHFLRRDPHLGYWRHWPEAFRRPQTPEVAEFARAHRQAVEFFWYLQWQAEVQLASVAATCRQGGMPIGLYRDLGVGIADDGGEAWARQDLLALGVTVGAPPDPLNHRGQDWGLAPFNPLALREVAFQPFIDVLRANMRHAGALRLDHAMQLQRLYWVPRGAPPDQGAYVRYPVDELFAIVALESQRNRCLVIGEDLGTVPEGFRERMFEKGIFGYRLFVFERRDDGAFKSPGDYLENALVSSGTHDLPSMVGYWRGRDLELREKLGLYPQPGMAEDERRLRQLDRQRLVAVLQAEGLLPQGFPVHAGLDDAQFVALVDAVHAFLDRTPCDVMMVQLEDVLAIDTQLNLPGTTDQHPNWRFRLSMDIATLLGDRRLVELARRLYDNRCAPGQRPHVRLDGGG